jgi:hypothetical protein
LASGSGDNSYEHVGIQTVPPGENPESWWFRMVKNGRRTAVNERTIGGRVLQSYGDHYSYLDTTTTSDGTPIYESRGFNGGQHTWYLLNSEIRRIGEIFAQAPDKFELVNDDRSGAFCRMYALDIFERQVVRDIAAAMRWTSPRKETYYHITSTMRSSQGSGSHWVPVVLEIEKTERPEATAAAAGTAVRQYETPHVYSPKKTDAPVKRLRPHLSHTPKRKYCTNLALFILKIQNFLKICQKLEKIGDLRRVQFFIKVFFIF